MELNTPTGQPVSAKPLSKLTKDWRDILVLLGIWLATTGLDGLWLWLDHMPPAWDQGEHLTRALNYWRVFQHPQWLSADWWNEVWRLSPTYRAPFVYLMTVPVLQLFGRGFDQAVLANSLFNALLLLLIYLLGRRVFDRVTGLWAAAVCMLVPILLLVRLDYLLDYGLVVCVLASFLCLTYWRTAKPLSRWFWAAGFGLCFGLTVLTKPTGILFLGIPMAWVAIASLWQRKWLYLLQWVLAAVVALGVFGPWVQTNWLTILSTSGNSNATWLAADLDPSNPLSVWSYYARVLPRMVTAPLLGLGLGGWVVGFLAWRLGLVKPVLAQAITSQVRQRQWLWSLAYVLGTYALLSLLHNKDPRHILAYVPAVVILLVRGLTAWTGRVWPWLRLALLGIMVVLAGGTLFPMARLPQGYFVKHPYPGAPWPHSEVIETILTAEPYLRSTVGVLPNNAQMNPMNVDFYGALKDFRVFGREVGFSAEYAPLDARSLTWVLAKTGEQGPKNSGNEAKADLQRRVEQSPEYQVQRTWTLPDQSKLALYHRQPAPVSVVPLETSLGGVLSKVTLSEVTVSPSLAAGSTAPVTYRLQGPWEQLADGLVVMTWTATGALGKEQSTRWIHDHGIGLGHVYAGLKPPEKTRGFEVVERLGMTVPSSTQPGQYQLTAQYLNRKTGEAYPLPVSVALTVTPAAPSGGPEPNLVSQLHMLSQGLADGKLDPVFNTVGRINQYDPIQDYLVQAEQAMGFRLESEPNALEWLYTRVLAQVLRQRAEAAIATLNHITKVAPENPYHWLYLGFVHLYRWHPKEANRALDQAATLAPEMPELKALQAVAAIQRLNLPRVWHLVQESGLLK